MHPRVDIARFINADVSIAHCMLPAWESGDFLSISNPSSIAVSFTEQRKATVQLDSGAWKDRNIPAGSFGTAGVAPIAWIRVREPSECLEVTASPALRASIAEELRTRHHVDLDDLHGSRDPVVWSVVARLRSLLRAPAARDATEFETLVLQLYRRLLMARFGGRSPSRGEGALVPSVFAGSSNGSMRTSTRTSASCSWPLSSRCHMRISSAALRARWACRPINMCVRGACNGPASSSRGEQASQPLLMLSASPASASFARHFATRSGTCRA